jgi:peptidoglycan/LPS O-acetylase OafA/YrhL
MSASGPAVSPPEAARLAPLDGLRGVAILMVLFHHLFVYTPPPGLVGSRVASVVDFASHGVDLFFALSGFLILRQLLAGHGRPGFSRRFWSRRAAKIVPLYVLMVALVFVALKPALSLAGQMDKLEWLLAGEHQWPWYLGFVSNVRNALDGRFTNPALDVAWSLGVEVQFYVLAFLGAHLTAPARWVRLAGCAVAGALLFRLGCVLAGYPWIAVLALTPGRLDAFAWGALAALAPRLLARCPLGMVWATLALPVLVPWSREQRLVEIGGYSLLALAAGIAIQRSCALTPGSAGHRCLTHPWLAVLGRISYSVYLIHLPLRAALRDLVLPRERAMDTLTAWLAQGAFWVGGGLVCVAAGWLTWRCCEEPARRLVIGLLAPRPAGPPPQAT